MREVYTDIQSSVRTILAVVKITSIAWNEQAAATFHTESTYPSALFVLESSRIGTGKARAVAVQNAKGVAQTRTVRGTQVLRGSLSLYVSTQQSSVDLTADIVDASPWRTTLGIVQVDPERDTVFLRATGYYTATLPLLFERDRYSDRKIKTAGVVTEYTLQISNSEERIDD